MTGEPATSKTPVREKGRRTRERLIEAAEKVFSRDGFIKARVADITAEAGVAHGTFYTYFDSKDDIFRALADQVYADIRHALAAGRPTGTAIERIHAANVRYVDAYERHAAVLELMEQVATFDPHFRELLNDLRRGFIDTIERGVKTLAKGDAALRDTRAVATALGGMVERFAYVWLVLGEPFDRDSALGVIEMVSVRTLGLDA